MAESVVRQMTKIDHLNINLLSVVSLDRAQINMSEVLLGRFGPT